MIITSRLWGETRSGKGILSYQTDDIIYIEEQIHNFDPHDHFDAYCLFQWLLISAIRKHGPNSSEFNEYTIMSTVHFDYLSAEFIDIEMKDLSLVTSIDVAKHGKSLLKDFFLE